MHVLICVPGERVVIEVWERRVDDKWIERRYGAPSQDTVENMSGPLALERGRRVGEHASPAEAAPPLRELAPLVEEALPLSGS
jgi:hypothetical protein